MRPARLDRPFRAAAWLLAALSAGCSGGGDGPTNVVLIVVDALRPDELARVETPAFDRLASDGVSYPQAFAHAADTVPSIMSLFTARLPHRSGVTENEHLLPPEIETMTEWLAARGWHGEASVGLATVWPLRSGGGLDRGFSAWAHGERPVESGLEVVARARDMLADERPRSGLFLFVQIPDPHHPYEAHGSVRVEAVLEVDGRPLAELSIADSCWWSGETTLAPGTHRLVLRSDRPFHLRRFELDLGGRRLPTEWGELDPEIPARELEARVVIAGAEPREARIALWMHDAPEPEEIRRRYRLEVAAADAALAALLAELDSRRLYDSSLIVLTADHGEGLGEHGVTGHSRHLHDELLHVPLVIKPPAGHPKSRALATTTDGIARHVDVLPTLADLLGQTPGRGLQGVSLFDRGERLLIAQTHPPLAPRHLVALRDRRFKMVYDVERRSFSMYDLSIDPGETVDVFARRGHERPSWNEVLRLCAGR